MDNKYNNKKSTKLPNKEDIMKKKLKLNTNHQQMKTPLLRYIFKIL